MPKENSPVTRRDSLDFRDRIYQPALVPLKEQLLPQKSFMNVRDQGYEGACSGFGLAAVIDYLNRSKGIKEPVSTRMLYEMAKRHDRWPGEDYEGSSARGAMKGWHKNGVCPEEDWPYDPDDPGFLTRQRQVAALEYPLGAYYRILPKRSDAHAALNEVEAIFATADTHRGWDNVDNGLIPYKPAYGSQGGHAFAILGYTEEGFIVQNSWGDDWGGLQMNGAFYPGCAIWRYDDFEDNVWDLWVARLALPVTEAKTLRVGAYIDVGGRSEAKVIAPPQHEIRDHYVHIDDGEFDRFGDYPSHEDQVREIIQRAVTGDGKPPKH
ncbi:MAG: peptidase C1, partial [Candidatus Latescibacteria bacterium]|nr:peptidase C1 [Candidatus Latescibacterota bacterium]NIO57222.1 peptidase C1 [Candidatus Latescibacterota bacterium]